MNYAVFSDIHGDIPGLKKIIRLIESEDKVDKILCLGDSLGNSPALVLFADILFNKMKAVSVKGNSDKNIITHYLREFDLNSPEEKALSLFHSLKETAIIISPSIAITHGSVYNDHKYVRTIHDARSEIDWMIGWGIRFLFHGHTHVPSIIVYNPEDNTYTHHHTQIYIQPFQLHESKYYLINPGSVGNPKQNSKAGIMLFNDETLQLKFVGL